MDEPKETQDVKTSEELKETSEKPETFTKSQRDKAVSDALAAAGRTAKSLEKREEAVKKADERMARLEQEKYEADKEAAKDDTDKLDAIERGRKERERKAELSRREAELEAREEKVKGVEDVARKAEIRETAMKLASKHDIDVESLLLTDGSTEKMEELAKLLPKKGAETPALKVDSGKTIGGEKVYKGEEVLKTLDPATMTPEEISKQVKELLKADEEGRIK